jgi:hypothetical protein
MSKATYTLTESKTSGSYSNDLLAAPISASSLSIYSFRYLDEQPFRFNNRKMTDGERFSIAASQIIDRRVTLPAVNRKIHH